MKTENGLYKFDIQLFAGTAFVQSAVLPATTNLKIAWNCTWPYQLAGSNSYLTTDSGSFSLFTSSDNGFGAYDLYINGIQIVSTLEFNSYWTNNCGDAGVSSCSSNQWVIIDTSEWSLSKRTIYSVGSNLATQSVAYEDVAVSTWTVTFDSNGGTAVSDITDVEDGATITAPTAPTRENYTFAGWFKEEALTNAWVFASDTVTADTTLYAKWVQDAFEKMQEFGRQIVERVNGKVTANTAITGATKPKITYDSKGLVTSGDDLARTDIPTAVLYPPTNTQDANYTLVLADDGKLILAGHATNAVKVTIPLNATVEFPTNTEIAIVKYLAGDVTIGTASGATLNGEASTTTFEITDQYGSVAIKKIGTDAWIMTGAFEEVV